MKIITNEGNPASLKILISCNFSGKNVDLETVKINDIQAQKPCRLPMLQLESSLCIFSANSAARFVFPPKSEDEYLINRWLEWESTKLLPALVQSFSGSKTEVFAQQLSDILNYLEKELCGKLCIVGTTTTVVDIVIWSTLFPIASDPSVALKWLDGKPSVQSWFKALNAEEYVKSALTQSKIKPSVSSLQNLIETSWFPSNLVSLKVGSEEETRVEMKFGDENKPKEVPVSKAEMDAVAEAWKSRPHVKGKNTSKGPVLPLPDEKNIMITSALPYVNNVPHLGNIIGCVLSADVFARFCRLRNYNTVFLCGTDEYGTATETKALEEGLTPQEICDKYFEIHDAVYKWFNISFDYFGRTTTPQQTEVCQEIFLQLYENGLMETDVIEQLLCEKCDRFLADRFVEGICPDCGYEDARGDQCDSCGHLINAVELKLPRCKLCQSTPIIKPSTQFFIDLPKIEPAVKDYLGTVWSEWSHNARVITQSWLREGLKPRCITRDLKWGIPVPLDGFRNKVFYVWFDAPIGYMSITKCYTNEWRKWWQPEKNVCVNYYNFIGKDNVPFHAVMFPATLLGANKGYTTVSHIMATEYLNYEDGKFSKSRGVGVFGTDAQITNIPSDIWRFYLLFIRPESHDSSFSWTDLALRNNTELLNNLGNFINRALVFVEKFFDKKIPEMKLEEEELILLALVTREVKLYSAAVTRAKLRDGIRHILNISRYGNQFMQNNKPWVLVKGSLEEKSKAATVVGVCANIAALISVLIQPYMPATSFKILEEQLLAPADIQVITDSVSLLLPCGHVIGKPTPLFAKIEQSHVDQMKQQFSGRQKSNSPEKPVTTKIESIPDGDIIAYLEDAVNKQGELVRQVKATESDKEKWKPHIAKLLDLKKQLSHAKGEPPSKAPSKRKS